MDRKFIPKRLGFMGDAFASCLLEYPYKYDLTQNTFSVRLKLTGAKFESIIKRKEFHFVEKRSNKNIEKKNAWHGVGKYAWQLLTLKHVNVKMCLLALKLFEFEAHSERGLVNI